MKHDMNPQKSLCNVVADTGHSKLYRRPFHVDRIEYPFDGNWFERQDTIIHYVDHGKGRPVFMLSGFDGWSYRYRRIIKKLEGTCRTIAPDYPGLGFSPLPAGDLPTPIQHAKWMEELVDYLNLKGIILVCEDWGGPIGLSIATQFPHRIAGLVLSNTWCWHPPGPSFFWPIPKGKTLVSRLMGGSSKPCKKTTANKKNSPGPKAYVIVKKHTVNTWVRDMEAKIERLKYLPVELVWSMDNTTLGRETILRKWLDHFPRAKVTRVDEGTGSLSAQRPNHLVKAIERMNHHLTHEPVSLP